MLTVTRADLGTVKFHLSRMLREGIASASVRQLVSQIGHRAQPSLLTIYQYVKSHFSYIPDPAGFEQFIHPRLSAAKWLAGAPLGGDCDDHSLLVAALLGAAGYQVRIALLDTAGRGFDHAAAQVLTPVSWLTVDTAMESRPLGWIPSYYAIDFVYP